MRENTFEHIKNETRVKFNLGLSANQPLNNWALVDSIIHLLNDWGLIR